VEKGIRRSSINFENDGTITFNTVPGQVIIFENGYE